MFGRRGDVHALDAAHHRGSLTSGKQRILGVILEVPAAQRAPVDIDSRCQPRADIVFLHFLRAGPADGVNDIRVKGAGQERRAREGGGRDADVRQNAQPRRAVRRHDVRNAELRVVAVAEGVGGAGIGLAAQQVSQILVRELAHKIIQRDSAFGDIDQIVMSLLLRSPCEHAGHGPHCGTAVGCRVKNVIRKNGCVDLTRCSGRQLFIASVRAQAL